MSQSITQSEYDRYNTDRALPADNPMSKEVEWWASDDKSAVGSIQIDKEDKDYTVGVLRKQSDGNYEMDVSELEMGIETLSEAREKLKGMLDS
jgi:hypothetical protein